MVSRRARKPPPAPIPGAATGLEWHRSHRDDFVGTVDGATRFLLMPTADGDWVLFATDPRTGIQSKKLGRYPTAADAKDDARRIEKVRHQFAPLVREAQRPDRDDIESAIEEVAQRMADENSATAWSTVDDQTVSDLQDEGYDPKTVVGIAEFGDAVAVNGDLTDKTLHGVEGELEAEGYEDTGKGGRIPSDEGYAYAESLVSRVAKELGRSEEEVLEAAKTLDWWQEEIPWGTSGYGAVWAKRKVDDRPKDDPDYVIQGISGDHIDTEFGFDDEKVAIREAKKLLNDPTFEGDYVRIISRDGELVWSSREEDRGTGWFRSEERTRRRTTTRRR